MKYNHLQNKRIVFTTARDKDSLLNKKKAENRYTTRHLRKKTLPSNRSCSLVDSVLWETDTSLCKMKVWRTSGRKLITLWMPENKQQTTSMFLRIAWSWDKNVLEDRLDFRNLESMALSW